MRATSGATVATAGDALAELVTSAGVAAVAAATDATEHVDDGDSVAAEYVVTQDPEVAVVSRDVPDESEGVIEDD